MEASRQRCEELELLLVQGPGAVSGGEEMAKRIQELEELVTTLEAENRQMRRQQGDEAHVSHLGPPAPVIMPFSPVSILMMER